MPLPISIVSNPGVTTGGGGGVTLDGAYDFGGPGAGRSIIADAGAVEVIGPLYFGSQANVPLTYIDPVSRWHEIFTDPAPASPFINSFAGETEVNPSANSTGAFGGFESDLRVTGDKDVGSIFGNFFPVYFEGTNAVSYVENGDFFTYIFGTPVIGDVHNLFAYFELDSGTVTGSVDALNVSFVQYGGSINEGIGIHVRNFHFGGTLTDQYGIKIKDVTGATNNWAIHTGIGLVEFGDDTIVNGKLTVTGAIDPVSVLLSDPAAGTALFYESNDGQTAPVSGAATGRLRYNNATGKWQQSVQGGPYGDFVASVVASSQTVLGTIFQTSYSTTPRVSNVGHARQYLWVASKESGAAGFTTISSMNSITTGQLGFIWSLLQDANGVGTTLKPLGFTDTKQSGMRVNAGSELVYGQRRHNWYLSVRMRLSTVSLVGKTTFVGLATSPRPFPGTGTKEYSVGAGANFCGVRFCSGENGGKWAVYVQSGGAAGTVIDTGVAAVASGLYDIEVWSDSVGGKIYASINGSTPVAVAAGLPAATQIMTDIMMVYGDILTGGGAAENNEPALYSGYYEQD